MSIALVESQIRSIETSIQVAQQQLATARREGDNVRVAELNTYLGELQGSLAQAQAELRSLESTKNNVSTGQTVSQATTARDDGANTQNPPVPPAVEQGGTVKAASTVTTPTNAESSVTATPNEVPSPSTLPGGTKPNEPASSPSTTQANVSNAGLIEPANQNQVRQSYVYKAIEVTSIFERGRFTQELEGRLLIFPLPPVTSSATAQNGNAVVSNRSSEVNESQGRGNPQTNTDTRSAQAQPTGSRDNAAVRRDNQGVTTPRNARASRPATPGSSDAVTPLTSSPPTSNGQGVALRNQNIPSATTRGTPDQNTQQGNKEY